MEVVVQYCLQNSINEIGVSAPPFHQLRSYMSTVTVAKKFGKLNSMNILSFPGMALDWFTKARHSQGLVAGPRRSLFGFFKYYLILLPPSTSVRLWRGFLIAKS